MPAQARSSRGVTAMNESRVRLTNRRPRPLCNTRSSPRRAASAPDGTKSRVESPVATARK